MVVNVLLCVGVYVYVCMCVSVYASCIWHVDCMVMGVNVLLRACVCLCACMYACMCNVSGVLNVWYLWLMCARVCACTCACV